MYFSTFESYFWNITVQYSEIYAASLNAIPPLSCSNLSKFKVITFSHQAANTSFPGDTTDNSAWHLQEKHEFKLLTNFTIRLTNEMQALSRRREPQKPVWSGWKEIIGGLISPIRGRNRWQSRRCGASRFWCIKSGSSLPRISSLSTLRTPKLSAFLSTSVSLSLSLVLSTPSRSHRLSLILSLLLKMMKDFGAHSHHYTPQTPKCVMVRSVRQNNGHLLRPPKPCCGTVIWKGAEK